MMNFRQTRRQGSRWLGILAVLVAGWGLLPGAKAAAASGASLSLSNRVATFSDAGGHVYFDATLVRADFDAGGGGRIIYRTNGDFNAIAFSLLTADTLRTLGVPDNHAELARQEDARRKEAALREAKSLADEQERLLDPTNLVPVKVDEVVARIGFDAVYGQLYNCRVHLGKNPRPVNVLVAKLPDDIADYYDRVKKQEGAVAGMKNEIAGAQAWAAGAARQLTYEQYQVEQARAQVNAGTAGMADWVRPAAAQRDAVKEADQQQKRDASVLTNVQEQISTYQKQLATLETNLAELKAAELPSTTRLMLPARRSFNGFQVFICAPATVQPPPEDDAKPSAETAPPAKSRKAGH